MPASPRKRNLPRDAKDQELGQSPTKKPNKKENVSSIPLLDFNFSADFRNQSWADMIEQEQQREKNQNKTEAKKEEQPIDKKSKEEIIKRVIKSPKKKTVWTTPKKEQSTERTSEWEEEHPTLEDVQLKKSRKAAIPKKLNVPSKFAKAIALTEAMNNRRSERILQLEKEKKQAEMISKTKKAASTLNIPNATNNPRKRRVSGDSLITINTNTTNSTRVKQIPNKSARMNNSENHNSLTPNPQKDWEEPKNGWCNDEVTLKRRTKEIQLVYNKDVYKRYIQEIPKHSRKKNVDPKTPNKYLNFSRRSWDSQVKKWKLKLYEWAGEEPSPSTHTSYCPSEVDDTENLELGENETNKSLQKVNVLETPDALFSLMGHIDMESRRGFEQNDESTLKGNPITNGAKRGPTDFKQLKP